MSWNQRPNHIALPDGGDELTEYRYCLDALLATIADMRQTARWLHADMTFSQRDYLRLDIVDAEARAADLAHRLFERWIEVQP